MPSTDSHKNKFKHSHTLVERIVNDFPTITFCTSDTFSWANNERRIDYNPNDENVIELLLHELAHSILLHENYSFDIELLKIESDAWDYVKKELAPNYGVKIDDKLIDAQMSTYRSWLYRRSLCPKCRTIGWQTKNSEYKCPECASRWTVGPDRFKNIYRKRISIK
jgi:hypothetical protein